MTTSLESVSKEFSPSAIGRWATNLHTGADQTISNASDKLVDALSKRAAALADGDREKLLGYVEGLKETLDANRKSMVEVIDGATDGFKAARLRIKEAGGSYQLDFAEKFNDSRIKINADFNEFFGGHAKQLETFAEEVNGVSDVGALKKLINSVGGYLDSSVVKVKKLKDKAREPAKDLTAQYTRYAEGFDPKSK